MKPQFKSFADHIAGECRPRVGNIVHLRRDRLDFLLGKSAGNFLQLLLLVR